MERGLWLFSEITSIFTSVRVLPGRPVGRRGRRRRAAVLPGLAPAAPAAAAAAALAAAALLLVSGRVALNIFNLSFKK